MFYTAKRAFSRAHMGRSSISALRAPMPIRTSRYTSVMTTPKRTHQIGVRVTEDELRRLKLRAQLHSSPFSPRPVATYLRQHALDFEPRRDPTPELVDALRDIADQLDECRRQRPPEETRRAIDKAAKTLRQLVAKVG